MNPKTEEAAAKLRAIRAEIEKEAIRLVQCDEDCTIVWDDALDTMRALLKASEIAKKELAEVIVEGFV